MLISTSYAYYVKSIKNNDNTKVVVKTANMLLRYYEGNQINAMNIKPNWEETLDFSIENYSGDTVGRYKIYLDIISPLTENIDENFVYSLEATSNKNSSTNKLVSISETSVPVSKTTLGIGTIPVGNIHNYKFKLKLKDNGQDQSYLMSRVFMAKIIVEYVYE